MNIPRTSERYKLLTLLEEYDYKDQYSNLECMFFRLHEYNKQQEQTVHGEYAFLKRWY